VGVLDLDRGAEVRADPLVGNGTVELQATIIRGRW
jgi:hypothetical protein